jgi:hypothetical protein
MRTRRLAELPAIVAGSIDDRLSADREDGFPR